MDVTRNRDAGLWNRYRYQFFVSDYDLKPGVPKQGGDGGIYPPNNLAVSPPNNLNGCTVHLSENWGKSVLFLMKTFFFRSSSEFG